MTVSLKNRNLLSLDDFTPKEIQFLLQLSHDLKTAKYVGTEQARLKGKNIALIFEKTSTRTRCAFEVAAYDQGANVTFIGPSTSQIGEKESIKDTARVLGRLYDGIEYRGFNQMIVKELAAYAGVPVWNGLTDEYHPTQVLADLMTMQEYSSKPLSEMAFCYLGDGHNNMGDSLLLGAAMMGMDFRMAAPEGLRPPQQLIEKCKKIADTNGGKISLTSEIAKAVNGVDFLYTDVWVSMGEPETVWQERIAQLKPYQVNCAVIEMTKNPNVKFMHCLPAMHNCETHLGNTLYEKFGLNALEVTDDVFESEYSIVFDQAENRLHTIKAVLIATLAS